MHINCWSYRARRSDDAPLNGAHAVTEARSGAEMRNAYANRSYIGYTRPRALHTNGQTNNNKQHLITDSRFSASPIYRHYLRGKLDSFRNSIQAPAI